MRFIIVCLCFVSCTHKIVILGNSILKHPPEKEIGWYGDWGMAATSKDSDFVHILIRDVHKRNPSYKVLFKNIVPFEQHPDYNFDTLSSFRNPDILIMRIGENVPKEYRPEFINRYAQLIDYINPRKVIITGCWWKTAFNHSIEDFAVKNGYTFIPLDTLHTSETSATEFSNKGVSEHPNNKGMQEIEQSIWKQLSIYL